MNATASSNYGAYEVSVPPTHKDEILTSIFAWGLSLFAASLGFLLGLMLMAHTPRFNHEGIIDTLGIFLSASPETQLASLFVAQTLSGMFASLALIVGFIMWGGMRVPWKWTKMGDAQCVHAFFGTLATISIAGAAFLMYANPDNAATDCFVVLYIAVSFFILHLCKEVIQLFPATGQNNNKTRGIYGKG